MDREWWPSISVDISLNGLFLGCANTFNIVFKAAVVDSLLYTLGKLDNEHDDGQLEVEYKCSDKSVSSVLIPGGAKIIILAVQDKSKSEV